MFYAVCVAARVFNAIYVGTRIIGRLGGPKGSANSVCYDVCVAARNAIYVGTRITVSYNHLTLTPNR